MAAAILHKLAIGHAVSGKTILPKLPFVDGYAPSELHHSNLVDVQCRLVSTANSSSICGYRQDDLGF